MLRSRVLTSVVLAATVLSALLLLSPVALSVLLALIFFILGGWEAAALAGLRRGYGLVPWLIVLLLAAGALLSLLDRPGAEFLVFGLASAGWVLLSIWLVRPEFGRPVASNQRQRWKMFVLGAILLAGFSAIAWMHAIDPLWVIFVIVVVAAADIGAFVTGSRIGGPKLAPRISPGKTWSGVVGGMVAGVLAAALAAAPLGLPLSPVAAGLAALLLVPVSICGDLTISLLKRHRQLKDTSALLPGHGGLLDRLDSLGAAAPVAALILALARGA